MEYCKKEGDYEEFGEKPKSQRKKEKEKEEMAPYLREGLREDEEWLKENEPNIAFKHMATFRSHKKAKKEPLNYVDTRMNGGSVQPELASPRRSGKSTQLIMLKRRTSGGVTTRDKTRS